MPLDPALATRINRVVGMVSLAFGLAATLGGFVFVHYYHLDAFIVTSGIAQGEVIENEPVRGAEWQRGLPHTSYRAIVKFTDQAAQTVIYRDWLSLDPPSFTLGQTVRIFYDPQNPQHAMIDRGPKNYLVPGIICAFGGLAIMGGLQRLASPVPGLSNEPTQAGQMHP